MATQNVRYFDGANDRIVTALGDMGAHTGAITILAVIKLDDLAAATNRTIVGFGSSGTESFRIGFNSSEVLVLRSAGTDRTVAAITLIETDGYAIVGFTKAAGTATSRGHIKLIPSGSWVHSDASSTHDDPSAATTSNRIGESQDGGRDTAGWIAAIGVFDTAMSDGTIETMTSLQAWADHANNVLLWRVGDDPLLDLTGNGADESAVTGTSIVSDLDDASFDLSITTGFTLYTDAFTFAFGEVAVADPTDITHALTIDNATLTQNHVIQPQDIAITSTIDNTTLTQVHTLSTQDIAHSLTTDATTINQNHVIVAQDITLSLTEDATTITQNQIVVTQDIALALTIDNSIVDVGTITIATQDIALALTVDNTTLEQVHVIAVSDILLSLTIDNATVNAGSLTSGFKYFDGAVWTIKPLKFYTGATWQPVTLKRYNGSSWVSIEF